MSVAGQKTDKAAEESLSHWFFAAQSGDYDYLKQHITTMRRTTDPQGMTALMYAADAGHTSCVQLLVDEACEISSEGFTALGYAIRASSIDAASILLSYEGSIEASPGLSPLVMSLKYKQDAIAHMCFEHMDPSQDLSQGRDGELREILMFAVELNDYGLLRDAIRHCHKLPAGDIAEVISLETATGPTFCITYLMGVLDGIAHQSDLKHHQPHYVSPAMTTATPEAVKGGPKVDENGNTLLMRAVMSFNYKKMLSYSPILCRNVNKEGKTALMIAAEIGNESAAAVLRKYESKIQDPAGMTALIFAVNRGNLKLVQTLVKYEAGLKDVAGRTALMHAVLSNKQPIIQELIKHETGNQDFQGKTALIYAVEQSSYQACKALIPHEAGMADHRGLRAIDYAKLFDNMELVDLLEDTEGISRESLQQILLRHGRTMPRAHRAGSNRSSPRQSPYTSTVVGGSASPARSRPHMPIDAESTAIPRDGAASYLTDLISAVHASRYYDISVLAPHLANMRDHHNLTALHHAIYQNKRIAVRLLLPHEYESLSGFTIPPATRPEIVEMINLYKK